MSDIEYRLFDPKEDFIFKMIFGIEENKSILISLLNSILKGRPYINDVTLENNEISKIFKDGKSSRLDILATDDNGIKYDIEMQCRKTKDIINRTLFYASKFNDNKADSASENKFYRNHSVISIWIFAENITDRHEPISEALMTFQPYKEDTYGIMSNNLRIIYLELNKYIVSDENIKYKLSKWVDFLKDPINLNKDTVEDKDIYKARKTLEYISTSKEERLIIEKIVEGRNDFYSANTIAREEGREEGKEEGKEEGLKEGEKNKSIEIAKNLLKLNIDVKIISQSTGLSIKEIEDINNNL